MALPPATPPPAGGAVGSGELPPAAEPEAPVVSPADRSVEQPAAPTSTVTSAVTTSRRRIFIS
ncbi:hypothetical protein [Micromonospora sp. NPDC050276]|uniref:hypothetical protein n=1 Tax=Micromonospora sp. NPDC050276 TaxID=3364278 RepID=UPI00378C6AFB